MITPNRLGRRSQQVRRSQLALEVALSAYALVAAALILRVGFLTLGVSGRVWAGAVIYRLTDPVVWPLTLLPSGRQIIVGNLSLPDLTAVGLVALVPLALVARNRSR